MLPSLITGTATSGPLPTVSISQPPAGLSLSLGGPGGERAGVRASVSFHSIVPVQAVYKANRVWPPKGGTPNRDTLLAWGESQDAPALSGRFLRELWLFNAQPR